MVLGGFAFAWAVMYAGCPRSAKSPSDLTRPATPFGSRRGRVQVLVRGRLLTDQAGGFAGVVWAFVNLAHSFTMT